jgi:integrase
MSALLAGNLASDKSTSGWVVQEKGELGGSQARQSLRILKKVLEDAFDNDLVRKNYARNIEVPEIVKQRKLYLVQFEQVEAIVAAAAEHCEPKWVPGLIGFFGFTGARKMEGVNQLLAGVNPMRKLVTIAGTKTESSVRTLDYSSPHLADVWTRLESHLTPKRAGAYLFTTRTGNPPASNIQRYLDVACRKAGLARLTPHMFRHSFATSLIYAGVPVPEVTRIMGHKNSQVTMAVYAHCWNEAGHLTYEWPESVTVSDELIAV